MSNKADTAKTETQLHALRFQLQQLRTPLRKGVQRLFTQAARVAALEATPEALQLVGLEQSEPLQDAVDGMAFSEQALIDSVRAERPDGNTTPFSPPAGAAGRTAFLATQTGQSASPKPPFSPLATAPRAVSDNPAAHPPAKVGNLQGWNSEDSADATGEPLAPNNHTTDAETPNWPAPDYLRQWIDELLTAPSVTELGQSPKTEAKAGSGIASPAKRDRGVDGGVDTHLPAPAKRPVDNIRPLPANSLRTRDPGAGKDNPQPPSAAPSLTPVPPPALLPGLALLQRLVGSDAHGPAQPPLAKSQSATAAPGRPPHSNNAASRALATHPSPAAGVPAAGVPATGGTPMIGNPAANAAAAMAKTGVTPIHAALPGQGNPPSAPMFSGANSQSPERPFTAEQIAELVNDALVEQALRNGVDLS